MEPKNIIVECVEAVENKEDILVFTPNSGQEFINDSDVKINEPLIFRNIKINFKKCEEDTEINEEEVNELMSLLDLNKDNEQILVVKKEDDKVSFEEKKENSLVKTSENSKDSSIKNKGSGAGGSNTNFHGKIFENITSIEKMLIEEEYKKETIDESEKKSTVKFNYMFHKNFPNKKIIYLTQSGLKTYMKKIHNIDIFRHPDEAFIIQTTYGKNILKILEKKEQNVEGSCIDKLWTGGAFKLEYEMILGEHYIIEYSYCLSDFLKKKIESDSLKFKTFLRIMDFYGIKLFYGKDKNYFTKLYEWIHN